MAAMPSSWHDHDHVSAWTWYDQIMAGSWHGSHVYPSRALRQSTCPEKQLERKNEKMYRETFGWSSQN